MAAALRTAIALAIFAPHAAGAQATAASPALRGMTTDPDSAPPQPVAQGDTDVTGGFAPAPEPEAPPAETTAATVPGIEDMLPDAGKATANGTGTVHATVHTPPADTTPPPAQTSASAVALPAGSDPLDSTTVQRIVDRLVGQRFLASAADAQDPALLTEAIRAFQASVGISPTGTLDRDTIGRLVTQ